MVLPLGDLHRTQIVPYRHLRADRDQRGGLPGPAAKGGRVHARVRGDPLRGLAQRRPGPAGPEDGARSGCATRLAAASAWSSVRVALRHAPCPIPVRWTLLTSMFLHGSWMHLIGNMLYLWIVGDNVEEVLGSFRYLIVYFACGLAGSLAQIAVDPDSVTPTLGASGAIAGIMGAYVIWFPHQPDPRVAFPLHHRAAGRHRDRRLDRPPDLAGSQLHRPGKEQGGVAYLAHVGGADHRIVVALLFFDDARYIKNRNAAAEGWSVYEGELVDAHVASWPVAGDTRRRTCKTPSRRD